MKAKATIRGSVGKVKSKKGMDETDERDKMKECGKCEQEEMSR